MKCFLFFNIVRSIPPQWLYLSYPCGTALQLNKELSAQTIKWVLEDRTISRHNEKLYWGKHLASTLQAYLRRSMHMQSCAFQVIVKKKYQEWISLLEHQWFLRFNKSAFDLGQFTFMRWFLVLPSLFTGKKKMW